MPEGFWQATDYVESMPFPKLDGSLVCRDNQIVLHRYEASRYGFTLRMPAHFGRNPFPPGIFCNNVSAVTDVCSKCRLVWFDVVSAKNHVFFIDGNKSRRRHLDPNLVSPFFGDIRRKSVSLTGSKYWLDNSPRGCPIFLFKRLNYDHLTVISCEFKSHFVTRLSSNFPIALPIWQALCPGPQKELRSPSL